MIKNATVASSYTGPVFPEDGKIDLEWVKKLIEFIRDDENVKSVESKTIHKKYMLLMLQKGKEILSNYKEALVDINIPEGVKFNVVGDVHGQFYDLLNIFKIQGFPSESNMFLFNGDFVDRGVFGVECVVLLQADVCELVLVVGFLIQCELVAVCGLPAVHGTGEIVTCV